MPNRPRAWGDRNIGLTLVTTIAQQIDLLSNFSASDTITAARLIGRLVAMPSSLTAQVEGVMQLDLAVGVVTDEAFVAAGAAIPNPSVEGAQPARGWLYKSRMFCMKEHDTGTTNEFTYIDTLQFDVRAARKVDRGKLMFVVESNTAQGTAFNVGLRGVIRALCLT